MRATSDNTNKKRAPFFMKKKIIDVACGGRMFWFDKKNPNVLFLDKRTEKHILCDGRLFEIRPDKEMDFTNLKFKDNSFKLVVFDPPHITHVGKNSWLYKKYGRLEENWRDDIKKGFEECWRILENNGVLIFKWSEESVSLSEVLKQFSQKPLFGHTTGKSGKTKWMCFMKI